MVREFDQTVGKEGLIAGGQFILDRFTGQVTVSGADRVPSNGPTIVASNHPGMTDAMAVWTAVAREDLLIIAAERDLLDHLPNMRRHLIVIQSPGSSAYREALAHLRSGGAVLTFPAGHIEPDAAVRPGAVETHAAWSPPSPAGSTRKLRPEPRFSGICGSRRIETGRPRPFRYSWRTTVAFT
jgi:hypothetical protein